MERGGRLLVVATMALAALCRPGQALAGEVLLESFEQPSSVRSQGPVSPARGADVGTEGKAALQLGQGGLVNIAIPAGAAAPVGWLKIDTFVAQPVLGAVRLGMTGWSTRGFVKPGKDTLCLPLCMLARGQTDRWPDRLAMRASGAWLNSLQPAQRGNLFRMLDTVACVPDVPKLAALQDEFRKAGQNKTFLLLVSQPTMLSCGLYCWATGADGFYTVYLFPGAPAYNPFWFDPRPLMLPNAQGGGERTLSFLMLNQGAEDFMLARRCEALARAAKTRTADVEALEQALADIRAKLQDPPGFDAETWRTTPAAPEQITAWRDQLMKAAAKLAP